MCLADRADEAGHCWPSIPYLCTWTCLKRTAVIEGVKWLERAGLLVVTRAHGQGNRFQIRVAEIAQRWPQPVREADESGRRTSPADGPVRQTADQSGKRTPPVRQADPTSPGDGPDTPRTIIEPSVNHQKTRASKSRPLSEEFADLLSDVDAQVLADFDEQRTKKRAPITRTALAGIAKEATLAGLTMGQALAICCERGWTGFKAEWVANKAPNETARAARMREAIVPAAERRANFHEVITGRNKERTHHADRTHGTVDVEARVLG